MFWRKNQKKRIEEEVKKYLDPKIVIAEFENGSRLKMVELPNGDLDVAGAVPVDVDGNEMPYDKYQEENPPHDPTILPATNCPSCFKQTFQGSAMHTGGECSSCGYTESVITSDGIPVSVAKERKELALKKEKERKEFMDKYGCDPDEIYVPDETHLNPGKSDQGLGS